jgi:hypothetical protein
LNSLFTASPSSGRDHVGGVARGDDVDLVDVEELGVQARNVRRIRLVVVVDQLDRPIEQAALLVDVFFPNLRRQQRRFAVGRQRAGQVHAEADGQRLVLGDGRGGDACRGASRKLAEGATLDAHESYPPMDIC